MPRMRTVKHSVFTDDRLAEVEPLGRLLLLGLRCCADREGRLENRERKIKAECLPYDEVDVAALLEQLEARGFLQRYAVDGTAYIALQGFTDEQRCHPNEPPSSIPAPPEGDHHSFYATTDRDLSRAMLSDGELNRDSCDSAVNQLMPYMDNGERITENCLIENGEPAAEIRAPARDNGGGDVLDGLSDVERHDFEGVIEALPRFRGKKATARTLIDAIRDRPDVDWPHEARRMVAHYEGKRKTVQSITALTNWVSNGRSTKRKSGYVAGDWEGEPPESEPIYSDVPEWAAAQRILRRDLGAENYTQWFASLTASPVYADRLVLAAPDEYTQQWLEKKLDQRVRAALVEAGHPDLVPEYRTRTVALKDVG